MSLESKLKKQMEKSSAKGNEKIAKVFGESAEKLSKEGIEKRALKIGDKVKDFELTNAFGKKISLKDLRKEGAVVISFYRGRWCPYCNIELMEYNNIIDQIKLQGANFIAISPEKPDESLENVKEKSLNFEVLSDLNNIVAKNFKITFKVSDDLSDVYKGIGINLEQNQGNSDNILPVPATYIIDKDGTVVYSFVNTDYTKRLEPSIVIEELEKLNK